MRSTSAVEMSIQAVSAGTTTAGGAAAAAGAASWKAASSAAAGRSDETTELSGLKVGGDLEPHRSAANVSENNATKYTPSSADFAFFPMDLPNFRPFYGLIGKISQTF